MSDLIQALRTQKQCDEYGEEVIVSRQACDEAADALEAKDAEIAKLIQAIADHVTVRCEQAAEIAELRDQVFWLNAARPNIAVVAENERLKDLCDQLGNVLEVSSPLYREHDADWHEALTKYREMKGGDDGDTKHRPGG